MNRFSIANIFISFAVLCMRSGICFGFAARRVGVRIGARHLSSRSPRSRLSRPMTAPTSTSLRLGRSETDEEEAEESTDGGRASTRKRLSNLARRFRRTFRPFPIGMRGGISIDQGASLDDASQRNASPIKTEETKERISQVETTVVAPPSDDQGTLSYDVSPMDLSIQTQDTEEHTVPIENVLVIPTHYPMSTRQSRSARHGK
jgi:hypothetical protein